MKKNSSYKICVIKGDGIGPEVIEETLRLLNKTKIKFEFKKAEAGFNTYKKQGTPLPEETVSICKQSDATLFGAVTTPPKIENYFSPIVELRKRLNLYANVRPFISLPIPASRTNLDFVIVRENTEGLYSGRERLTDEGAVAERVVTKKASERIINFAFKLAKEQKRKKVTLVHKANILRLTDGLFLSIGQNIAKHYPDILFEDIIVDACAMKLVKNPEEFDVLVTTNLFGDILSDEAAALVGGLGVAASANIGESIGLFEPVHGSAPKYTGKNKVNPTAAFLSASLMLDFLGEIKTANKIRNSVFTTMKEGCLTYDLGGKSSMSQFTNEVIKNLSQNLLCS